MRTPDNVNDHEKAPIDQPRPASGEATGALLVELLRNSPLHRLDFKRLTLPTIVRRIEL